jgi:hypothetical protein
MQRVDDRVNDPFDRRNYNAWVGVWRDEQGNHYRRFLLWHPRLWWDVFKPNSLYEGMRLRAIRLFWSKRKELLWSEEGGR